MKNPSEQRKLKFDKYRNHLTKLVRITKRNYYFLLFEKEKNNISNTWKVINKVLNRKGKSATTASLKCPDNAVLSNPKHIAEYYNNFFVNIGPDLAGKLPQTRAHPLNYINGDYSNSLFLSPISRSELLLCINNLPNNKSPGHDEYGSNIIKMIAPFIIDPLLKIFNLSIATGVVPNDFKLAKVIPIFKTGYTQLVTNYRPISILPCFSKLLERLVANRLNKYISKYNILSKSQYGFRANYSTQLALIDLVDKISSSLDKCNHTVGIFVDLSKAFDTIDHEILLSKLNRYGIRGTALEWFKHFLTDRKQFVFRDGIKSSVKSIICGVPQGSILGPILFLIYINDICNSSCVLSFLLFADDTNILFSHRSLREAEIVVNNELRLVSSWLICNRLSINLKKTSYMIFTNKPTHANVKIVFNGTPIDKVNYTRFLGVIIDNNLTWKYHCQKVQMSVARTLGILRKLKCILPSTILLNIYNTLILPHLQYGILAWGNSFQSNLNDKFVLQKRALRIINLSNYRAHAAPLFVKYNTLTVFDIYKYHLGVLMFKVTNKLLPSSIRNLFTRNNDIHKYNTRNAENFHLSASRTSKFKSTVRHQ